MYGPVIYPLAWALQPHSVQPFDAVLTHGQAYVDRFAKWLPVSQLPVIGYPRYDDFFSGKLNRQAIRESWGVSDQRPVLAFLPTWGDNTGFDKFFPELLSLSNQYQIILRPHHCTLRFEPTRMAMLQASKMIILDDAFDLSEVYRGADVVLSDVRSGSLFEACLCNVPTVGMVIDSSEINGWLLQNGINKMVSLCDNPLQLKKSIEIALSSKLHEEHRKQWSEIHIAYQDGHSALHAAEALIKIAESRVSGSTPLTRNVLPGFSGLTPKSIFETNLKNN